MKRLFLGLGPSFLVAGAAVAAPTSVAVPGAGCAGRGALTMHFDYRVASAVGTNTHGVLVDYGRSRLTRSAAPIVVEPTSDWQSAAVSRVTVPDGVNVELLIAAATNLEVKNVQVVGC